MRMKTIGKAILIMAFLASVAPILTLTAALATASVLGCQVDEGSVHPCLLLGHDIGDWLYTGMVLGWLMFVTAPLMLVCLMIWVALAVIRLRR